MALASGYGQLQHQWAVAVAVATPDACPPLISLRGEFYEQFQMEAVEMAFCWWSPAGPQLPHEVDSPPYEGQDKAQVNIATAH